ncbi:Pyoverdine/dityrosine biosynthesis protein-domain-containing protein [Hypomontagnella monticulosa]|nr:Pyoverdine/dityrosine biosynthesis protein-domain-containing protein [Hypomontagnella monticulosa]
MSSGTITLNTELALRQLGFVSEIGQVKEPIINVRVEEVSSVASLSLPSTRSATPVEAEDVDRLAGDIFDVIQRYSQHLPPDTSDPPPEENGLLGKSFFMDRIKQQLEKRQAIRMILPAFPWKSINRVDKVTGILPDLGEELALCRLNQLCEDIKTVYPPGGTVVIANDGLVFDDVVGISDEHTWAYSEGLMDMAREKGFNNIELLRPMEIMGLTQEAPLDKELYMSLAQKCREELMTHYGRTEIEVREMMKDDPDTLLTYLGFVRFLDADLRFSPVTTAAKDTSRRQYKKKVKQVAIMMMIRAESFTKVLQAMCPDYVRLSIHQSRGLIKLSVPLVVQGSGEFPRSPWHSCVALSVDGSYSTVHSQTVRESHNLIQKNGRGYYYREKSELWDWEDENVIFQPEYPNRLVVRPVSDELWDKKLLTTKQRENLKELQKVHIKGPVEVVGFGNGT